MSYPIRAVINNGEKKEAKKMFVTWSGSNFKSNYDGKANIKEAVAEKPMPNPIVPMIVTNL